MKVGKKKEVGSHAVEMTLQPISGWQLADVSFSNSSTCLELQQRWYKASRAKSDKEAANEVKKSHMLASGTTENTTRKRRA